MKAGCPDFAVAGCACPLPPPPPLPLPPQDDDCEGLGLGRNDGLLLLLPLGNGSGLLGLELGLACAGGSAVPDGEPLGLGNSDCDDDGLGDGEHDDEDGDAGGVGGWKLMDELGEGLAAEPDPFAATSVSAVAMRPSNANAIPSRFMGITSYVPWRNALSICPIPEPKCDKRHAPGTKKVLTSGFADQRVTSPGDPPGPGRG